MKTDFLVIGAGSGGITAAVTAAGFGKKVLLVDKNLPGGECTWSGCVPSKALIHQAHVSHIASQQVPGFKPDTRKAMAHVHDVRNTVYSHESPEALADMNIEFLQGHARFIDPHTVEVGENRIQASRIIVASGSSAFIPPVKGLTGLPYLTNENMFELEDLPDSMIVLGGGPIGIELAQALNRLGVRVELVEMAERILPREEAEFALPLSGKLETEGVKIHAGTRAVSAEQTSSGVRLTCQNAANEELSLEAEHILVAVGRTANAEHLNLEAARVEYTPKGISVNRKMQTSQKHIYAIGDVVGPWLFSHMANTQGIQAVQNAILPWKRNVSSETPVWVTYTEPELARAGMSEDEARKAHGNSIRMYHFDMNDLDRTRTGGPSIERVKLILDRRGRILGASILADRAGEMIGEIQVIRKLKANFGKLAGIVHPYPSYSEVFQKIGKRVVVDNLLNHPLVKLFRKK
ncbi:dihydrolipoyl dehydrogenase family protein [Salinispira pacifica]|uniref:Mercuric ion reductase n=1 Tax=Salinispira pacifica TaxID=1307761 RepID=V5WLF3_9SPIO|nr:NAD(P)/FAD-dependent oxidoreductase [Salinispira pacifica]AHC16707.1 Mercuric ion reductase [Salinispira pacifica]